MKKILNEVNLKHNVISSSGSGTVINYASGTDFLTSYGSGSTSQKVTVPMVPVPVPAPYLDHKKQIFKKIFEIFFTFYLVSCFTRKKFMNFNKFMVKCE